MEDLTEINECKNCGYEPFISSFCPSCGQKKLSTKDFHLSTFIKDSVGDFLNFDNTFFRTLRVLFAKPNYYASDYMRGARKKYISPLKFFILSNAFYFLFPAINTFTTTLHTQLNQLPYSPLTKSTIEKIISTSDLAFSEFENEYNFITQVLSKALLIIIPLIFAFFTWCLNTNKKDSLTPIFHINYALILLGFYVLFLGSIIPGIYFLIGNQFGIIGMLNLITETNLTISFLTIINIFGYFLYRGFFSGNMYSKVGKVALLNLLFIPLIQTYRFILLVMTLGWMELFR